MRAVRLPDLLVAALAERHGVTVVHYDADYDAIATITGKDRRTGHGAVSDRRSRRRHADCERHGVR